MLDANEHFGLTFSEYLGKDSKILDKPSEFEKRRKRLALEEISPFVKGYIPNIATKRIELLHYLENESNIDSDIVSLI